MSRHIRANIHGQKECCYVFGGISKEVVSGISKEVVSVSNKIFPEIGLALANEMRFVIQTENTRTHTSKLTDQKFPDLLERF